MLVTQLLKLMLGGFVVILKFKIRILNNDQWCLLKKMKRIIFLQLLFF